MRRLAAASRAVRQDPGPLNRNRMRRQIMRKLWWSLVVMWLGGPSVIAQPGAPQGGAPFQPGPAVTLNPTSSRLDAILMSWEQAMRPIRSASAQCTHTVVNKVLKDKEVFEGTAQFMKPNLAVLDLKL